MVGPPVLSQISASVLILEAQAGLGVGEVQPRPLDMSVDSFESLSSRGSIRADSQALHLGKWHVALKFPCLSF